MEPRVRIVGDEISLWVSLIGGIGYTTALVLRPSHYNPSLLQVA